MKIPFQSLRVFGALGVTAALMACGDSSSITQPGNPSFHTVPIADPEVELLAVCKVGPPGTYEFDVTATQPILFNTGSGTWDLSNATYQVTVGASSTINVGGNTVGGACFEFTTGTGTHNHVARASGSTVVDVTVVEDETASPAGVAFVMVDKYQKTGQGGTTVLTSSNVNTVTAQVGGTGGGPTTLVGANVVFYNEGTPQTGEGCTPGYWKQSQHFDSYPAGYTSDMLFFDAFGVDAFPGLTLSQVAALGGGGLNALGRHAVAALLNSASDGVDYDLSEADVISAFAAAYASGDYETQKNIFAGLNELGCPLN